MTQIPQLAQFGLFAARAPRYTSYPTAPHFGTAVGEADFIQWVKAIAPNSEISLYLHVPFCRRLCWFCACRTQGTSSDAPVRAYAQTLKAEIALLKARLQPYRGKSFAAIVEPKRFGDLIRAIRSYKGGPIVRTALQLAPMLFQRPGNLREMEWAELDLDAALWTIPSMKMKRTKEEKEKGDPHAVPLPTQAVALLRSIHPISGHGVYVFPGERSHDRPISDNSVRSALYALDFGLEQSWHGFRASARTMIVDELNLDPLAIEANLAHAVKDSNGRSYNRTQYLKQRFDMAQQWADYLDKLAQGAEVIQFKATSR